MQTSHKNAWIVGGGLALAALLALAGCGSRATGPGDAGTGGRGAGVDAASGGATASGGAVGPGSGGAGGSSSGGAGTGGLGTGGLGTGGLGTGGANTGGVLGGGGRGGAPATGGSGGGAGRGGATSTGGTVGGAGRGGANSTGGTVGGGGRGGATATGGTGGGAGQSGACAFASTYTMVESGGLAGVLRTTTLSPPNSYLVAGRTGVGDAGTPSCSPTLPACRDATLIDVSDVDAALAHGDVQAAFAAATPPVYGNTGIADGPSVGITRGAGGRFRVEIDCTTPSPTCNPTPPGIAALIQLLRNLNTQQLADASCTAVRN